MLKRIVALAAATLAVKMVIDKTSKREILLSRWPEFNSDNVGSNRVKNLYTIDELKKSVRDLDDPDPDK